MTSGTRAYQQGFRIRASSDPTTFTSRNGDVRQSDVRFLTALKTNPGEKVYVVGSCAELGNWDVDKGIPLRLLPQGDSMWVSEVAVHLATQQRIYYKYVIKSEAPNNSFRWEDYDGNRTTVPTGMGMVVKDHEGAWPGYNSWSHTHEVSCDTRVGTTHDSSPTCLSASQTYRQSSGVSPCIASTPRDKSCRRQELLQEMNALVGEECDDNLHSLTPLSAFTNVNAFIIVAFETPVRVILDPETNTFVVKEQNSFLLPQLHSLRQQLGAVKFIGWPGITVESEHEKRQIQDILEPYDCIPVHLSQETLDMFASFCNQCLWPAFHNVVPVAHYDKRPFNIQHWAGYQKVNRAFCDVIAAEIHETDLIWLHDYYLLLVPQLITRRMRKANVGLFLHTPFPSSEIFRCLPVREEILRGMLCADLIGFQFFEYARHFLVAAKRILGLEHRFRLGGILEVDYGGRRVMIFVRHVHIQSTQLRHTLTQSDEVKGHLHTLQNQYRGRFIFAAVDRRDRLSGILLKLRGFQYLLQHYKNVATRAVLVQYIYPTICFSGEDETLYIRELESLAADINSQFSSSEAHPVVVLELRSVSPAEKYALFQCAGCLLDTSVRDGLNTNPFEYICCHKSSYAALILSEFTGCSRTLASALRINPWKSNDIARAMDYVLNCNPEKKLGDAFLRDETYIICNSTLNWAREFLKDLRSARKQENLLYVPWGFGTNYRLYGVDSHFQYLNCDTVIQAFKEARAPVLFFDHEGTLAPDRRRIRAVPGFDSLTGAGTPPSEHIRQRLESICASGIPVIILSGRNKELLEEWFGQIKGIGLCAEHGFYYKIPTLSGSEWTTLLTPSVEGFAWKDIAIELMRQYVKRTQGAFIENKGSALVFQYRDADPDFGCWQAQELSNYLQELLFRYPVTVVSGKGYVEVKLRNVNKGQAVAAVLKHFSSRQPPLDFVFCIGDDRSDEDMFPVVNSFFSHSTTQVDPPEAAQRPSPQQATSDAKEPDSSTVKLLSEPTTRYRANTQLFDSSSLKWNQQLSSGVPRCMSMALAPHDPWLDTGFSARKLPFPVSFSVTVGKKPSSAKYFVNDVEDVSELVYAFSQYADKTRLSKYSFADLHLSQ